MAPSKRQAALVDVALGRRSDARSVEWGVVLDDAGSTDLYDDESEARAALESGGVLVSVFTTVKAVL